MQKDGGIEKVSAIAQILLIVVTFCQQPLIRPFGTPSPPGEGFKGFPLGRGELSLKATDEGGATFPLIRPFGTPSPPGEGFKGFPWGKLSSVARLGER